MRGVFLFSPDSLTEMSGEVGGGFLSLCLESLVLPECIKLKIIPQSEWQEVGGLPEAEASVCKNPEGMNELGLGFVGQESGYQVAQSDAKKGNAVSLSSHNGGKGLSFVKAGGRRQRKRNASH